MRRFAMLIAIAMAVTMAGQQAACKKSEKSEAKAQSVQMPAVAGEFYPASKEELKKIVDDDLAGAPEKKFDGEIMGLIAPHAGYIYSGKIAAAAFKQLKGRSYKRVVVLGLSHRMPVYGADLSSRDFYRTPLGDIPIDTASVKEISRNIRGQTTILSRTRSNTQ